jgi:hypothetical protein
MGPPYEIQTFDRMKLLGKRWYFRIVDTGNWETVAQSEGYSSPYDRNETANDLSKAAGWPIIPERKKR